MSNPLAATTGSDRKTIGDILLSHGYVTEQQLDHAAGVQRQTGKPLGQVLVEAGVITRLELASALAEQWSDSSDWMLAGHDKDGATHISATEPAPSENGTGLPAPRRVSDDGTLVLRVAALEAAVQEVLRSDAEMATAPLEHALADLARRVTTWEPLLAELERRAEASVDPDALETQLSELVGQVDEALRRGAAGGEALGLLQARLDELAGRPTADPTLVDRLDGLAARLDEVDERPAADPAVGARLDDLAHRLEELSTRQAHDSGLHERLDGLAAEIAAAADRTPLDELRASIASLAGRPSENAELAERVEDLARRVDALVAEAGARVQGDVPEELRAALEELATRPPVDAALAARVEELAAALATLPGADELRTVRETVLELASRATADQGLSDRVWHLAERVDALADARDTGSADELRSLVEELRTAVDALEARPIADPAAENRLEQADRRLDETAAALDLVSRRLDELATATTPSAELEALRARLDESVGTTAGRLEELAGQLSALESLVRAGVVDPSRPDAAGAPDGELDTRLADIAATAEELAAEQTRAAELWYAGRAALEARLDDLESRLAAGVAASRSATVPVGQSSVPQTIEQEVERVLMAVERLGLHLSEHDRALAELMSRRGPSRVEELAARIDELETYGVATVPSDDGTTAPVVTADTRDLRAELRLLARQVSELEDITRTDREKLLTQLERMASSIDWRIRRLESGESSA